MYYYTCNIYENKNYLAFPRKERLLSVGWLPVGEYAEARKDLPLSVGWLPVGEYAEARKEWLDMRSSPPRQLSDTAALVVRMQRHLPAFSATWIAL
ncbi:MAG: hypothetical protein AAGJ80_08295 [Cyanobacteria bacterium J06553_1]